MFWSRKLATATASAGLPKGTITTVPAALNTRGSFLVRVESELEYKPVITWAAADKPALGLTAAFDNISMKRDLLSAAAHELAGRLQRLLSDERAGSIRTVCWLPMRAAPWPAVERTPISIAVA